MNTNKWELRTFFLSVNTTKIMFLIMIFPIRLFTKLVLLRRLVNYHRHPLPKRLSKCSYYHSVGLSDHNYFSCYFLAVQTPECFLLL